jgi:hypothetical protein
LPKEHPYLPMRHHPSQAQERTELKMQVLNPNSHYSESPEGRKGLTKLRNTRHPILQERPAEGEIAARLKQTFQIQQHKDLI